MAKHGGVRKGSGRPKGSVSRLDFKSYWTDEEIETYMNVVKEKALTDTNVMKWAGEMIMGKAVQRIEGGGEDGAFTVMWKKVK